jgi:hypothetical protein
VVFSIEKAEYEVLNREIIHFNQFIRSLLFYYFELTKAGSEFPCFLGLEGEWSPQARAELDLVRDHRCTLIVMGRLGDNLLREFIELFREEEDIVF